jgi:hypothetical protein
MAKRSADQIGQFAERLADIALLALLGKPYDRPLFRTALLGEKFPTADILVEAIKSDGTTDGHCFVQVKGTANASPSAPRLAIDVELAHFNRLVRLPAPAYLVAVDIVARRALLVAACRPRRTAVTSVTKAFPLSDEAVMIDLHLEVRAFWVAHRTGRRTSRFHDV